MTQNLNKNLLIGVTGILFSLGVFCQLFSFLIPEIFYVFAFCLMIGLLIDYAWGERKSLMAIIPAWLAVYPLYLLIDNLPGLRWLAFYLEYVYFAFFPICGLLFIYCGIRIIKIYPRIAIHFICLGLMSTSLLFYELGKDWTVKKHMPQGLLDHHHSFKWIWLLLFLQALIIDATEKLGEKKMIIEQSIIRWILPLISIKFFADYLFI